MQKVKKKVFFGIKSNWNELYKLFFRSLKFDCIAIILAFWVFFRGYASVRVICWNMYVIWSFYPYIQQCLCNRCAIVELVADGLWKTMSPQNICILHLFCHLINNPLPIFFSICKNHSYIYSNWIFLNKIISPFET